MRSRFASGSGLRSGASASRALLVAGCETHLRAPKRAGWLNAQASSRSLTATSSRLLKNQALKAIFLIFAVRARGVIGRDRRGMRGIGCDFASYSTLQTDSSRCGQNLRDANEIVGGKSQDEEPFHQAAATMPGLAQTADGLHPPKGFFDPLALDRADAIAGMTGRARVNRGAAVGIVLRDMRRTAAFAAAGDKVGGVVVLVAAHGAAGPGIVLDHVERGRALCCAVGLGQPRIDDEAIAVLHHQMPHVAEFGLPAGTLAEQASVRVGGREMRVVPALLAVEVALGVAPTATMTFSRRRIAAVLRHKALH